MEQEGKMSEACQDCRGTGYVPNDPDLEKLRLCLTCGGTGELDERDKDWEEEKLELARRLLEGWTDRTTIGVMGAAEYTEKEARIYGQTDTATFAGMDAAAKATKEKLEAAFSKADQPEASPEDRPERSRIIGDIVKELVFGNGKED
jgi:hypothetical protein